ncbi:rod-binding protein [Caulobacter segnis]
MSALDTISTFVPQFGAAAASVKTAAKAVQSAGAAVQSAVEDTASDKAKRAKIAETAKTFEASFLSVMMQQMFEGVKTSEPFGGGNGEEMFKSMMTDAMSKEVTKAGGVGLSSVIQREMLKMQGLKEH